MMDYRLLYDGDHDTLGVVDCHDGIPFGLQDVTGIPCWEERALEERQPMQRGSSPPLPGRRYKAILMDPPWSFITYTGSGTPHRTEDDHYDVMTLEDIKRLPVAAVADDDCALFMWVIGSHIPQAIALGESWGFEYKTDVFHWLKIGKNDPAVRPISMGYWSRKQVETCLLFTKGSPSRLNADVRQVIEAPKGRHSAKPDEQYESVEALVGGPYLEMFARTPREGWSSWGNEAPGVETALWRLGRALATLTETISR